MADPVNHMQEGMFRPRGETDRLLGAAGMAERVVNLQPTPEGSLRTISGPAMLVDESDVEVHGVGHAVVRGKEILVRQTTDRLQVFEGWASTKWRDITSPTGASGTFPVDLPVNSAPQFPPVFIPTPAGLIIIPKGANARALFFDGETVEHLGYTETPAAPEITASRILTVGDIGTASALPDDGNRVGVVTSIQGSTTNAFRRERDAREGVVQWINKRGDLSPISSRSARIDVEGGVVAAGNKAESALYRIMWRGVDAGPPGTVGRILGRTRSLVFSGTAELFEVPQHTQPSANLLSTIPDNIVELYSDNIADGGLISPMIDVAPMPLGRVAAIAFGRLWVFADDGALWFSLPGRWGTFRRVDFLYPDVAGSEGTGLISVPGGLIATTMTSTHFITPNDDGTGFRSASLSSRYGCVAPASMGVLPTGQAVWLGRDGFVGFSGGVVARLPEDHPRLMRQLNKGRLNQAVAAVVEGVYHCWVPHVAAQVPNLCLAYNGAVWNRRTDVQARHVTVTQDYRAYTLVAGVDVNTERAGVLVLDRESSVLGAQDHTAVLETTWLPSTGVNLKSIHRLILWGRETGLGSVTVEVMRDWREDVVETMTIPMYAPEDPPTTWDTAVLGSDTWKQRRPFFGVVDLDIPSTQAVKFRFTATAGFDFLGFELQTRNSITAGSGA